MAKKFKHEGGSGMVHDVYYNSLADRYIPWRCERCDMVETAEGAPDCPKCGEKMVDVW